MVIIDVFICKRRMKLANASGGRNFIETVWGRGYVLREPQEEEVRIPPDRFQGELCQALASETGPRRKWRGFCFL
jgi:hypothetical protein